MRDRLALVLVTVAFAGGCVPSVGTECDEAAATEVVYDREGNPAYPGQALLIANCGGGGFCHSPDAPTESRFGAPAGLDFDLRPLSSGGVSSLHLGDSQSFVTANRDAIFESVRSGAMPPSGVGSEVVAQSPSFDHLVAFDPLRFRPMDSLDSAEGQEVLRNFLACGARVVEGTSPRLNQRSVGWIEDPITRGCVDSTWESIYANVIEPGCVSGACHDAEAPVAGLDLTGRTPSEVAERLIGAESLGSSCRDSGLPQVDPAFDPNRSLFYIKLADPAPLCGRRMPIVGSPLGEQRLCAIRTWIACGACSSEQDTRCNECTEAARVECGTVLIDGEALCAGDPG